MALPPANTSRKCPVSGHTHPDNRKCQSVFLCVACGHTEYAYLDAPKNIRGRGLKLPKGQDIGRIVCEVNCAVRPSAAGTCRSEQAAEAG
ncbi:zinc ribbon domain-containing protein [Pseudomonas serbica]|uniref:zinc ribbon domain-containing protein n=1 Tax=Pseudomonas serbica TaxID=2965074 RepID=UPI00237A5C7F|nr:zinc ribbon domain-containing protein [Pseudomonas serbica]